MANYTISVFKDYSDAVNVCKKLEEKGYVLDYSFSHCGNGMFAYVDNNTGKKFFVYYGDRVFSVACEETETTAQSYTFKL